MNRAMLSPISRLALAATLAGAALALAAAPAAADEGMWLLTNPPLAQLKERYGFEATPQWLEHVQKSAVRFTTGGSGSLVSADGLVMTNHHVGSDMLAKLSTPDRDLLKTGFYAKTREQELKCPDLELHILWTIEDVTDKVNAGVKPEMPDADANTLKEKNIAAIAKDAKEKTGLLAQVVTLWQGGRYHLYCYKRYTDIRLVFAPEQDIAFFGGDNDNFEFPRYNLDVTFFRIYDNGKPLKPEHFLAWSDGSKEGDLALVIGHPGRTQRLYTTDHLRFMRDHYLPTHLSYIWRDEVKIQNFMSRSAENHRIGMDDLFGIANSRKALTGQLAGLQDPQIFGAKSQAESSLLAAVRKSHPEQAKAWDNIAAAESARREWFLRHYATARTTSDLGNIAQQIVRLVAELPKPNADRLREFRDSELDSVYVRLYSPAPIYDALEQHRLASYLSFIAEKLGADDPFVVKALAGKSPADRAAELVAGTTLKDPARRKALVEGGAETLNKSTDPLIRFALDLDPELRALRKRFEDQVEAVEKVNYATIAKAKFAIEGEASYPDATFTLRLSFGPIKGYQEGGQTIPAYTTLAGLYDRAAERKGQEGFDLPQSWIDHKKNLNLQTPFNFVCTADIIGGNSGSPAVNTRGEVIGLIFDGNIQSLPGAFIYSDKQARALCVDSRAIIEALDKVYSAGALIAEIRAKR